MNCASGDCESSGVRPPIRRITIGRPMRAGDRERIVLRRSVEPTLMHGVGLAGNRVVRVFQIDHASDESFRARRARDLLASIRPEPETAVLDRAADKGGRSLRSSETLPALRAAEFG